MFLFVKHYKINLIYDTMLLLQVHLAIVKITYSFYNTKHLLNALNWMKIIGLPLRVRAKCPTNTSCSPVSPRRLE